MVVVVVVVVVVAVNFGVLSVLTCKKRKIQITRVKKVK
jgi:hypothetical protein